MAILGARCRVSGAGCRVQGAEWGFRVRDEELRLRFGVWG